MARDLKSLKLQPDSVVEALMELRFSSPDIADIIPAKLSNFPLASKFILERLPLADMPLPMRRMDPNLAVSPILQQKSPDGSRISKLGEQVFAWHVIGQYPGWSTFAPEIHQAINFAFATIQGIKIARVGLRYLNVFSAEKHSIFGENDLAITIAIADRPLAGHFNLNYIRTAPSMVALVKLATPDFVNGAPTPCSLVMDIDVGTSPDFICDNANQITDWLERAHMFAKSEFFAVISDHVLTRLAVA